MSESSSAPEEIKPNLPPPVEIAKIAAALRRGPRLDKDAAIEEAIAFYLAAKVRYDELAALPVDQILSKLQDSYFLDRLFAPIKSPKRRLYPDGAKPDLETKSQYFSGGLDPVRQYLFDQAKHLHWNKSRTILEAIELFKLDRAYTNNEEHAEEIRSIDRENKKRVEDGVPIERLYNEWRMDGPVILNRFMNRCTTREREDIDSEVSEENDAPGRPGRVLYWEFEESFLNDLVRWRLDVKKKKRGGIKAVAKAMKKYWAPGYLTNHNLGRA
jgi:hypothetical protein